MKIRSLLLNEDDQYSVGDVNQIADWHASSSSIIWLDIEAEPSDEIQSLLQSLGCNPLAIKDGFRSRHPPKVEAFDEITFLLFRGVSKIEATLEVVHQQIAIWVGPRLFITLHRDESLGVSHLWESEKHTGELRNPGVLALSLLHYSCGLYLETMLDFEERLADLEDGLFSEHSEEDMKVLVGYRSQLRRLRRTFSYHKELSLELLNSPTKILPFLDEGAEHKRRDVYDRCERVYSLCQMYYEISGDLVEGYISLSSHNLNQTMKVLTIISALFVPLTFIAGIYGMNFEIMPELSWKYAYFVVLGFMALLAISLLLVFKRIRWL